MQQEIQLACFDVDHTSHPETKRASSLDHVCIASIGKVDNTRAPFLADICSFDNPHTQFLVARIQYGGRDDPALSIIDSFMNHAHRLEIADTKPKKVFCLEIDNTQTVADILLQTWKCYGGSWIICADCSDKENFLATCRKTGDRKLQVSEARDILVSCSRLAAATFDDDILDLITRHYTATQMRELILNLATTHGCTVQMLPNK